MPLTSRGGEGISGHTIIIFFCGFPKSIHLQLFNKINVKATTGKFSRFSKSFESWNNIVFKFSIISHKRNDIFLKMYLIKLWIWISYTEACLTWNYIYILKVLDWGFDPVSGSKFEQWILIIWRFGRIRIWEPLLAFWPLIIWFRKPLQETLSSRIFGRLYWRKILL